MVSSLLTQLSSEEGEQSAMSVAEYNQERRWSRNELETKDDQDCEEIEVQLVREGFETVPQGNGNGQAHRRGMQEDESLVFAPMEPYDSEPLKKIHEECFPVQYKDSFYVDIGRRKYQGKPLLTVMARRKRNLSVDDSQNFEQKSPPNRDIFEDEQSYFDRIQKSSELVGGITAQVRPLDTGDPEQPLLSDESRARGYTKGCYVLTLATESNCRRLGVGSALLERIIELASQDKSCGVVYLHVITYNETAIRFYERHNFKLVTKCDNFYKIDGNYNDSYLYALYIGDAQPATRPQSLWAYLFSSVSSFFSSWFS